MASPSKDASAAQRMVVLTVSHQVFFPITRGAVDITQKVFDELCHLLEKTNTKEIVVVAAQPGKRQGVTFEIGTSCRLVSHAESQSKSISTGEGPPESNESIVHLKLEGISRVRILSFDSEPSSFPVREAQVQLIEEGQIDDQNVAVRALVHSVQEKVAEHIKQLQDKNKTFVGKRNLQLTSSPSPLADMVGSLISQLELEERQRILETLDVAKRMELVMDYLQRENEAQKISGEINSSMQRAREVEIRQAILQRQIQEVQKGLQRLKFKSDKMGDDTLDSGESDENEKDEKTRLAEMVDKARLPPDAKRIAKKELRRLKNIQPQHPEYTIAHTYLETLASLPWNTSSEDRFDISAARRVLEADHQGLEKVKKRILEFLAVQKMRHNMQGPILCFHGPPGIGKTSLGKSIAKALGRKFHRIALGGVRDEAELRGHRRTYIGSMPGAIVQAMQSVGVNNPVILLDEIDKMSQNQMFNPQATLLEILDPEQNNTFKDHYINTAIDLSKVLFIATANDTSLIDRPLLDRMEVIELSGYTVEEKVGIARTHLFPKQRRLHALERELSVKNEPADTSAPSASSTSDASATSTSSSTEVASTEQSSNAETATSTSVLPEPPRLLLSDNALRALITRWTAESGVRSLERRLAQICRWSALRMQGIGMADSDSAEDKAKEDALSSTGPDLAGCIHVDAAHLPHIVGVELFDPDIADRLSVGVAMGLSVSGVGGQLLFIEATRTHGKGRLTITGQLGKVMVESVETAMSLIRSRFVRTEHGIIPVAVEDKHLGSSSIVPVLGSSSKDSDDQQDPFKGEDIHVHFPAGGIPKDGPSAGVAVLLALTSLLVGRPMRSDTAVTGEVSLRGHVLPVGGIRDKILAAHRAGVQHVLIPLANKRHVLEEVPAKTLEDIEVHYIKHVDEAVQWAFGKLPIRRPAGLSDVTDHWTTATISQTVLPPQVAAASAAARCDYSGTVFVPPCARL